MDLRRATLGFVVGVALAAPARASAQESDLGSSVPCAVPLAWRLDSVDRRFALSESEAEAAVARAAALWEGATGRRLFQRGEEGAMGISFRYDDRQAMVQRRREMETDLAMRQASIEERRAELEELSRDFEAAQAEYAARLEAHDARIASYQAELRRWSEEATVPEQVREGLNRTATQLNASAQSLRTEQDELEAVHERLSGRTEALNRDIEDVNRRSGELEGSTPASPEQAGRYSETVRTRNGEVVEVHRRIDVHRFVNREELVRVIAHELGHALGLGHASVEGAIMSAVSTSFGGVVPEPALHPADVEMLRARCPGL